LFHLLSLLDEKLTKSNIASDIKNLERVRKNKHKDTNTQEKMIYPVVWSSLKCLSTRLLHVIVS
jgi:hypothetical protein